MCYSDPDHSYAASWPALVSDDVFFAVRSRLKDPKRSTTRPGRAKHLLSMIARCDVCGAVMASTDRFGARRYQCQDAGHVLILADPLDRWTEAEVLAVLVSPQVVGRLMPQGMDDATLSAAQDEVARVREEHRDLIDKVGTGKLSATLAAGSEPGILARLKLAEARVEELLTPAGLRQLIEPGPEVEKRWAAMPMSAKREVVRLLFAPGRLGVLSVTRVDGGKTR